MKPVKIYIASHFFNDPIFQWTEKISKRIEEHFGDKVELYVPQRNDDINNKTDDKGGTDIDIYKADIEEQLMTSDILVASLDGDDSGVAGEIIGAAMYNLREDKTIPIIGITTDMRYGAKGDDHFYINKMIVGAIKDNGVFIQGKPNQFEIYMQEILQAIEKYI